MLTNEPNQIKGNDDILLEEITRKLEKKYEKLVAKIKINEIDEMLNINEFESKLVNDVTLKFEKVSESSKRNIHFMRL